MSILLLESVISGDVSSVKQVFDKINRCVRSSDIDDILILAIKLGHTDIVKTIYCIQHNVLNKALYNACLYGRIDIVKFFVEQGADINQDDGCCLMVSCEKGYLDIVKFLVENGADVNGEDNCCSLEEAANHNHLEIVKYLIENDANIHNDDGWWDLPSIAARYNYLEMLKYFVEELHMNIEDGYALSCACHGSNLDIIKYLVEHGAIKNNDKYDIVLESCKMNNNFEITKYLIEKGFPINNKAIIMASSSGYLNIVKLLIENGADVHVENNMAVRKASFCGKLDVVKYLVEQCGANINASSCEYYLGCEDLAPYLYGDAICYASSYKHTEIVGGDVVKRCGHSHEVVKYLVEKCGANVHSHNETPIRNAIVSGNLDVVKFLIENGAKIHPWDHSQANISVIFNDLDVAKYLVENCGVDIHLDSDLFIRAKSTVWGNFDKIKYLIEQGADIHANSDEALRMASRSGCLNIVKYLVENGADIHANSDEAIKEAYFNNHYKTVRFLIESGVNPNVLHISMKEMMEKSLICKKPTYLPDFRKSDECSISDIKLNDDIPQIGCATCLNIFEKKSLKKWFEMGNNVCPICRTNEGFYIL